MTEPNTSATGGEQSAPPVTPPVTPPEQAVTPDELQNTPGADVVAEEVQSETPPVAENEKRAGSAPHPDDKETETRMPASGDTPSNYGKLGDVLFYGGLVTSVIGAIISALS